MRNQRLANVLSAETYSYRGLLASPAIQGQTAGQWKAGSFDEDARTTGRVSIAFGGPQAHGALSKGTRSAAERVAGGGYLPACGRSSGSGGLALVGRSPRPRPALPSRCRKRKQGHPRNQPGTERPPKGTTSRGQPGGPPPRISKRRLTDRTTNPPPESPPGPAGYRLFRKSRPGRPVKAASGTRLMPVSLSRGNRARPVRPPCRNGPRGCATGRLSSGLQSLRRAPRVPNAGFSSC
jgi:hypothetical protein